MDLKRDKLLTWKGYQSTSDHISHPQQPEPKCMCVCVCVYRVSVFVPQHHLMTGVVLHPINLVVWQDETDRISIRLKNKKACWG